MIITAFYNLDGMPQWLFKMLLPKAGRGGANTEVATRLAHWLELCRTVFSRWRPLIASLPVRRGP